MNAGIGFVQLPPVHLQENTSVHLLRLYKEPTLGDQQVQSQLEN